MRELKTLGRSVVLAKNIKYGNNDLLSLIQESQPNESYSSSTSDNNQDTTRPKNNKNTPAKQRKKFEPSNQELPGGPKSSEPVSVIAKEVGTEDTTVALDKTNNSNEPPSSSQNDKTKGDNHDSTQTLENNDITTTLINNNIISTDITIMNNSTSSTTLTPANQTNSLDHLNNNNNINNSHTDQQNNTNNNYNNIPHNTQIDTHHNFENSITQLYPNAQHNPDNNTQQSPDTSHTPDTTIQHNLDTTQNDPDGSSTSCVHTDNQPIVITTTPDQDHITDIVEDVHTTEQHNDLNTWHLAGPSEYKQEHNTQAEPLVGGLTEELKSDVDQ